MRRLITTVQQCIFNVKYIHTLFSMSYLHMRLRSGHDLRYVHGCRGGVLGRRPRRPVGRHHHGLVHLHHVVIHLRGGGRLLRRHRLGDRLQETEGRKTILETVLNFL